MYFHGSRVLGTLAFGLCMLPSLGAKEAPPKPTSFEDVQRHAGATLQTIRSYTYEHKGEYEKKLQNVLDQLDREIAKLKKKASRAGAEARRKYQQEIEELRPLRDRAHAWL